MLEELKQGSKLVGAKQTRRALKDGRAKKLYMAKDADPRLLQPLVQEAVRTGVRVEQVDTMRELGLRHCRGSRRGRSGVRFLFSFGFNRIRSPYFVKINTMPHRGRTFRKEEKHAYF